MRLVLIICIVIKINNETYNGFCFIDLFIFNNIMLLSIKIVVHKNNLYVFMYYLIVNCYLSKKKIQIIIKKKRKMIWELKK